VGYLEPGVGMLPVVSVPFIIGKCLIFLPHIQNSLSERGLNSAHDLNDICFLSFENPLPTPASSENLDKIRHQIMCFLHSAEFSKWMTGEDDFSLDSSLLWFPHLFNFISNALSFKTFKKSSYFSSQSP
jgi:hypothetical protein